MTDIGGGECDEPGKRDGQEALMIDGDICIAVNDVWQAAIFWVVSCLVAAIAAIIVVRILDDLA
jgi:hypothetical protein